MPCGLATCARLVKGEELQIELQNEDAEIEPIPVGQPRGAAEPELVRLSDIIDEFNGINWLNRDRVREQIDELPSRLEADEAFVNAVQNSNRETALQQFNRSMMMIAVRMLNENTEFTRNYLDNPEFQNFINQRVFNSVYDNIRK